jgi:hypothetical protein
MRVFCNDDETPNVVLTGFIDYGFAFSPASHAWTTTGIVFFVVILAGYVPQMVELF